MNFEEELKDCFIKGLAVSESDKNKVETFEFSKFEQWDSIGHMRLIAQIEEKFGIRLQVQDVLDMNSFDAAKRIIGKYTHSS